MFKHPMFSPVFSPVPSVNTSTRHRIVVHQAARGVGTLPLKRGGVVMQTCYKVLGNHGKTMGENGDLTKTWGFHEI